MNCKVRGVKVLLFNSVDFFIFFPVITVLYFLIPKKIRWVWLLICSYYFYMCWNPKYAILLALSTIITYLSGILIEKANYIEDEKKLVIIKKLWVFISFTSNLSILFLFKYFNFFSENLIKIFSKIHILIAMPSFDFVLPVGISFYTLQALSYTMDVYRKDVKVEKNLFKYALYVSFFPQLLSGPIVKSKDFLYQLNEEHTFDYDRVKSGLLLMIWGYFQKVLIADRLAILVNKVYSNPGNYRGFEIITASVFFAFQIYCDFCGYSNIAIGAAEVMGFRLTKNFERPYFSKSTKEFWRRWHISLSSWFKDYLYIPLGGNRCSKLRKYFNIMVVFLTSGLWHGAALNFLIWGGLHGIYQVIGDLAKPLKKKLIEVFKIRTDAFVYKLFQVLSTFIMVDFAWMFFKASSFKDVKTLILNMMHFNPEIFVNGSIYKLGLDSKNFFAALLSILIVLTVDMLQRNKSLRVQLAKRNIAFRWSLYLAAILSIIIFGIYGSGYSAQQFIYVQF